MTLSKMFVVTMREGWPSFDYILANWTLSQFQLLVKAMGLLAEEEKERHEEIMNGKPRETKISDTEMFARLGIIVGERFK